MATSGITVWSLTRDDLINAALRKCQVLQEDTTANATQITTGSQALNNLVAEYRTLGMSLWKRTDYDVTMVDGQQDYVVGVGEAINTAYPLRMLQARLQLSSSNSLINLNVLPDYDFNKLPINSSGIPVSVSYQPKLDKGTLSVWPIPDSSTPAGTVIKLTYSAPTEIFNAGTDTADFPPEWYNALIYGLASLLSDEYVLPITDKQWIEKQAAKHLDAAVSNGTEDGSLYFQPDNRR